jgi:hypothetical protein
MVVAATNLKNIGEIFAGVKNFHASCVAFRLCAPIP